MKRKIVILITLLAVVFPLLACDCTPEDPAKNICQSLFYFWLW